MKLEFATIRDVAKAARVSPATVSRHLNKSIVLPAETAARIERACKRLAYRPNQLAKRLSLGSSELIGIVTPEISNPFFAALAAAAEDEARRLGYSLLIMSTGGDPQMEFAHIDRLDSRDIDGVIILTNRPDDGRLREIVDGRRDVVLIDEDVPGAEVARIFVENEQGAYMATRHLLDAGHERIAHIGGPRDLFSARERFAGFARALAEAGVAMEESLVRFGAYERAAGYSAVKEIMAGGAPTALFAGSDYLAIGALAALREMGLDVAARSFARRLRRHAFRRMAPSAVDDRAPADRRDGRAGCTHPACSDQERRGAGLGETGDRTRRARLGRSAQKNRARPEAGGAARNEVPFSSAAFVQWTSSPQQRREMTSCL